MSEGISLKPAEPVEKVEQSALTQLVKQPDAARTAEIERTAKEVTNSLGEINSPSFSERINDLSTLAADEMTLSSDATSRLMKNVSIYSSKKAGDDASSKALTSLADLRNIVSDLTPNDANMRGPKKLFGLIPGSKSVERYFQRYQSAETHIEKIVDALLNSKDEILKDNAALQVEREKMWENMGTLNEYALLAQKVDDEVVAKIAEYKSAGKTLEADTLEKDILFVVRQRRQDIYTQLAVAAQAYMAMKMVQDNNRELSKGIDRTRTTTVAALQTAVMVRTAVANQERVLDQLDAVDQVSNDLIVGTSEMLKDNTSRINERAVNTGVSMETLKTSFDNILATMDEVDRFKLEASGRMQTTINSLEQHLSEVKPALERSRLSEQARNSLER